MARHKKNKQSLYPMCSASCIYFQSNINNDMVKYEFIDGYKHAVNVNCHCLFKDKPIKKWQSCKYKKEYSQIKLKLCKDELIEEVLSDE